MRKAFLFVVLGGLALFLVAFLINEKKVHNENSQPRPPLLNENSLFRLKENASSTSASTSVPLLATTSVPMATSTPRVVTHIKTPEHVKAFYMTSWIASTKNTKQDLIRSAVSSHMNAMVIDVKDNTGVVSWEGRVKEGDLEALIDDLHAKGFYLIARITAFQDPLFAKENPSEAIHLPNGTLWKSKKGEAWVDPGSKKMWDYLLSLGEQSYEKGFDEINYDYIRFSTDGLNEKLVFPQSGERGNSEREAVITDFYTYITDALHLKSIPVSGDVFGIITTSNADIPVLGQNFETALKHFDYVAPMVYPSHYAAGTFGYKNPAAHPGPVITESLRGAIKLADTVASSTGMATSTVRGKIRPWYQDFNMGAVYTAEMVKAQIDAGKALGIDSYMMWDPSNRYTLGAYR